MPLYNKRPYVARSIKSIREQTYPDWELIIVDDGSTDGSADMVPRDDCRIKLFRQENMGPGAARNRAVELASGDYIALIDADDCYYPFKLETGMDLLWREQKAEWMMSAYHYELDGVMSHHYMKDINDREIKEETRVFDDAMNQLIVSGWPSDGLFMKRTLFERLGGFREDMRYGEITEFIVRCALLQPKLVICHIPLLLHIDVPGSTAKIASNKIEYQRQMGESLYELSKQYPRYSDLLVTRSYGHMISYAFYLILTGRRGEARRFLLKEFPYSRNMRWWKIWIGSWLSKRLIQRILKFT